VASDQPNPIDLIRRLADALEAPVARPISSIELAMSGASSAELIANQGSRFSAPRFPKLVAEARAFVERARVIEVPECNVFDSEGRAYVHCNGVGELLPAPACPAEAEALRGAPVGPCTVHVVVVPGGEK
jgi:hypothetical protein